MPVAGQPQRRAVLPRRGRRGFALIIVLTALGLLASLFLAFGTSTAGYARLTGHAVRQAQIRAAAESGLTIAVTDLVARALDQERLAAAVPLDGSWRACRLPDAAIAMAIQDVAGRVDLNAAGPDLLRLVVDGAIPEGEGQALLAAIAVRRAAVQARQQPPLRHVAELAGLPGATPEGVRRLEPFLTTWSFADGIAPEAADPALLRRLAGVAGPGPSLVTADGLRLAGGFVRDLSWRTFLISIEAIGDNGSRAALSAVVGLDLAGRSPATILDQRWLDHSPAVVSTSPVPEAC